MATLANAWGSAQAACSTLSLQKDPLRLSWNDFPASLTRLSLSTLRLRGADQSLILDVRSRPLRRESGRHAGTFMSLQQVSVEEHGAFVTDVAMKTPPPLLPPLLRVLEAKGEELVSPADRRGIISLAVPLTRDPSSGDLTALLRWPTAPEGMDMPVVRVQKHGLSLLAKTVDEFLHLSLAEEDAAGGSGRLAAAAGAEGAALYRAGDFAASNSPNLDVYLTKKVGMFPAVVERLALRHLDRGDEVSALVTGEFYASRKHFPGFGRPFVFNAQLLTRVGRQLEAKDAARIALKSPWWTLGAPYKEVSEMAGYGDAQLEFAQEKMTEEGKRADIAKGKEAAQVALDQAAFLLDLAAADGSWDATRERLAALYQEGGLSYMSRFVLAGPR